MISQVAHLKADWQETVAGITTAYRQRAINVEQALQQMTSELDQLINRLIQNSLTAVELKLDAADVQSLEKQLLILAVGGYGRQEMFPYSDVDLLITYSGDVTPPIEAFSSELVRQCWDTGLKLGHAIRSVDQTVNLAKEESQVATSLVHSRVLWGNDLYHEQLNQKFSQWLKKSARTFFDHCQVSRKDEVEETAAALYSLEPDVKCSPGTLRDLQLIQWVGFAMHQCNNFESLVNQGALRESARFKLDQAHRFFSEIRMELHIEAGRAQDVLTRQEQLRLTELKKLTDRRGQRAVERYMQQYFRMADFVQRTTRQFLEMNRPSTFQERMSARFMRKIVQEKYIIVNGKLNVISQHLDSQISSLESILDLFLVADENHVQFSSRLMETIRTKIMTLPRNVTKAASQKFLKLLNRTGRVAPIVRALYESGALEILIPHFTHARGLLQFNNYHAYTVDEHTFRALEAMDQLSREQETKEIFRELRDSWILSLALIMHDLGKGFDQDHSVLGAEFVREVAHRLHLPEKDAERVELLVFEHLSMSMLAFRRDTSDPTVVAGFARKVRDVRNLKKLYLLTISDIQAVAPDIWNEWKAQLLSELYERTLLSLGGRYSRPDLEQRILSKREDVLSGFQKLKPSREDLEWVAMELQEMPLQYLLMVPADQLVAELRLARHLNDCELKLVDQYDEETGTLELVVLSRQPCSGRCFHRMTGVLTAAHFSILSADIYTSEQGFLYDRFLVQDRDLLGQPSPEQLEKLRLQLTEAAARPVSFEKLFQKQRRFSVNKQEAQFSNQKTYVSIDNDTSPSATIIDIFAMDRSGLLFTLSKALYDLDLSVSLARIATHVDQVVDIFYVTDLENNKITDEEILNAISDRMDHVVKEFERFGHHLYSG